MVPKACFWTDKVAEPIKATYQIFRGTTEIYQAKNLYERLTMPFKVSETEFNAGDIFTIKFKYDWNG